MYGLIYDSYTNMKQNYKALLLYYAVKWWFHTLDQVLDLGVGLDTVIGYRDEMDWL